MRNGNISVGNSTAPLKSGPQMAGAMSQQSAPVMGSNQGSPQKFVHLVGCREPKLQPGKARPHPDPAKQ